MAHKASLVTVFAVVAALVLVFLGAAPAGAQSVQPRLVEGNPTCASVGYAGGFEFKIDRPEDFVGAFFNNTWVIDGANTVTISSTDDVTFSWSASLGIDAVIAKGGNAANVYDYNPEATSDSGLHPPANASGDYARISHIQFCYDYELTGSKTATAEYTREYTWTITKSVTPDTHTGFAGDSFSSNYSVFVDQTVTEKDFAVKGTITVNNNAPYPVNATLSDTIPGATSVTLLCTNPLPVPAVGSATCDYTAVLPGKTDGTNTVIVSGSIPGFTATANFAFGEPTTEVGYPTINVTDSLQGPLGSASGDDTFPYNRPFTCSSNPADYTNGYDSDTYGNTATITETGQFDDASVTVNCYAPVVTKDASTSFTRTWDWSINKTGDQADLTLSVGQQFLVNYEVVVSAVSTDSDWAVSGTIWVKNPHPTAVMSLTSVSDVAGGINAPVNCPSLDVPANETLTCTYDTGPQNSPNANPFGATNTATAIFAGANWTGTAPISFSATPTIEVDECIDVTDDQYGSLGMVCAGEAPKIFQYSLTVGPYEACGTYQYINTASFVTNDTGATDSSSWTVNVNVPCGGCTLTQGYWKTHSMYGPAPYDDTWAQIGEGTPFFLSGQSYYEVLWTAPAGNAYYNLAPQYIAAELNLLNGAGSTPTVITAMSSAKTLFETYTPAEVAAFKGKNGGEIRNEFLSLANILDSYNNGYIGPGHCDE